MRLWRMRKFASAFAMGSSSSDAGVALMCDDTGRDAGCDDAGPGAGPDAAAGIDADGGADPGLMGDCRGGVRDWAKGVAPGANMLFRFEVEGGGVRAAGEMVWGGGVRLIAAR